MLSVVADHVNLAWQAALGVLREIMSLREFPSFQIRIQVLDVDDGGAQEYEEKDRLRNAVLHDPGQADTAWALLIAACARYAAGRSGTASPWGCNGFFSMRRLLFTTFFCRDQ